MIKLTRPLIQSCFRTQDFNRGFDYYRQGRVTSLFFDEDEQSLHASCTVRGKQDNYSVSVRVGIGSRPTISGTCTCPQYDAAGSCKHLAAALLALLNRDSLPATPPARTSGSGRRLLAVYQERSRQELDLDQSKKARLVPRIRPGYGSEYPSFTFQVGFDKLYVVKDVQQFLMSVNWGETVAYGKNLSFFHHMEQFDAFSRKMITLLMNEFSEFQIGSGRIGHVHSYGYNYRAGRNKNEIVLAGDAFDRWFDLFVGAEMLSDGRGGMAFLEGDPEVAVSVLALGGRVQIKAATTPAASFFGNHQSLYAIGKNELRRCTPEFREKAYPMLSIRSDDVWLARSDLPAFCSFVLPEIQPLVTLKDESGLLNEYLPDACTPCYYFDLQADTLTATIAFRYGDEEIPMGKPAAETPGVRRDAKAEQTAAQPLKRYFLYSGSRTAFFLEDEDEIFSFLTGRLAEFRSYGEVYISESLRRKRVSYRQGAQVGVSVSGGLLTLDIDTDEFPPEELEALYHSLLQKKTYHRLADGRYLELNGSPYETLAETAHMLQLSPDEIKGGSVTMPAFRGLYLDSVLKDAEGLSVRRDQSYRAMLRAFKSVAESDYTLPDGMESVLRPYQKYGFQWLKTLEANGFGGILADEMGLGKTVQMIAWLSTVPRGVAGAPSLVVCPTSLILNWADECAKFAPALNVRLVIGSAAERKRYIEEGDGFDVWVTSYDLLKRDIDAYAARQFYCVILDEGQNIKNKSTLASKAVKKLRCHHRFVLTGTPIENRLSELWNLFDFLMPGYLFSHNAFMDKLERPIAESKNPDAGRRLSLLVQPFLLRRMKQDVLRELPPKIEHVRNIGLSEGERKTYLAFAAAAKRSIVAEGQGKLQILAALTRLRQLCCDPNLCLENYEGETSKLDACIELCASMVENGHQILLFSQFTTMLSRIEARLRELRIPSYTLQGSTPKEKRSEMVKSFQAGGASVFLISLKAGGTGLNLTAADVVIHYDPWWNLAAQNQATDRAHRIGQDTTVHVYKLIAKDTIEEKILELQSRKAELMDIVTAEPAESLHSMSNEELLELFA